MTLEQFEMLWKRYVDETMQDDFVWQLSFSMGDDESPAIIMNESVLETFNSLSELVSYLESQLEAT